MQYITSVERLALKEGRDEGLKEGRETTIRLLSRLLTHRFGELPESLQARLHILSMEQTESLVDVALICQTLAEFADHLPVASEVVPSN